MSQQPDSSTRQEGRRATSSNSTATWLKSKDPRIVSVSKTFGGKDRHSKVCTVRGLRDRRVRLSVPTAIQLYDLQDKLGLNQPSKVFDWLLNAAKHEIDELPPLPIIQSENFSHNQQPMLISDHHEVGVDLEDSSGVPMSKFWNLDFCEEGKDQDQTTFNNFVGGHDVHQNFDSVSSASQILLCPSGATQSYYLPSSYGFNIGDRSETS